MNRLMSQGHAMRSTRAFSQVTYFMDGPSTGAAGYGFALLV